jgi:hypothetical protein
MKGFLYSLFSFYRDGFRNMPSWGRSVWMVIIVKLFIMFAILRIFFFPDLFKRDFDNDVDRSRYMMEQLTKE